MQSWKGVQFLFRSIRKSQMLNVSPKISTNTRTRMRQDANKERKAHVTDRRTRGMSCMKENPIAEMLRCES